MNTDNTRTNPAQARKFLHDWLDENRPWARCKDGGVYEMMEEIVEYASFAFTGERRPSEGDMERIQQDILAITATLESHPPGYSGPCQCAECRSYQ